MPRPEDCFLPLPADPTAEIGSLTRFGFCALNPRDYLYTGDVSFGLIADGDGLNICFGFYWLIALAVFTVLIEFMPILELSTLSSLKFLTDYESAPVLDSSFARS